MGHHRRLRIRLAFSWRKLLPAGVAAAAVALIPVSSFAYDFCWDDPAISITTASGHQTTLYVTSYASGSEHAKQLAAESIDYSVSGDGQSVTVHVFIPDGDAATHFTTAATVSTGPQSSGELLAGSWGQSGNTISLTFSLADSSRQTTDD